MDRVGIQQAGFLRGDMQRKRKIVWAKVAVLAAAVPVLLWAYEYGPDPGYAGVPGENGAATEWSHTTLPFLREGEQIPQIGTVKKDIQDLRIHLVRLPWGAYVRPLKEARKVSPVAKGDIKEFFLREQPKVEPKIRISRQSLLQVEVIAL